MRRDGRACHGRGRAHSAACTPACTLACTLVGAACASCYVVVDRPPLSVVPELGSARKRPLAKLVEQDEAAAVAVDGSKLGLHVHHAQTPLREPWSGGSKFGERHAAVVVLVDAGKGGVERHVLPQPNEQRAELAQLNVLVAHVGIRRRARLGGLKGTHQHRLGREERAELEDVTHALVDLGKGEDAVAVDVHAPKGVRSLAHGSLAHARR